MRKINPNLLKLAGLTYNPDLKPLEEKVEDAKEEPEKLEISAKINRRDYIQIPNTNILISKEEIHRGKDWEAEHFALAQDGLFMPSPAIFMPYFTSVLEAEQRKKTLYDGERNPLSRAEIEDLYKYLTSGHRNGCWTWFDAKFTKGRKGLELETEHHVIKGKLIGKTYPLENYLKKDCFVSLDFNSQGLPIRKAKAQVYKQGENIRFWYPREGKVARFDADSGGAWLVCYWSPSVTYASLGVFACVAGDGTQKIRR